jgi:arginase
MQVGGDHSVSIGVVQAILESRPETGIVWVNSHADINTPVQSLSGNLHGECHYWRKQTRP